MSNKTKRFILPEEEIPHYWYNIQTDMVNKPMPPLHPGTKQPLSAEDLYPIFAEEFSRQELKTRLINGLKFRSSQGRCMSTIEALH